VDFSSWDIPGKAILKWIFEVKSCILITDVLAAFLREVRLRRFGEIDVHAGRPSIAAMY
jgi:hypothetical protein